MLLGIVFGDMPGLAPQFDGSGKHTKMLCPHAISFFSDVEAPCTYDDFEDLADFILSRPRGSFLD